MSNNRIWFGFASIGLLITTVASLTWFNYRFAVQNPGGNDFLVGWMGARKWLKEGISPYDERVSLAVQEMVYGHPADPSKGEELNHFVYPLHSMVFFAPFGLLDFAPARALWMTLLEISLVLLVFTGLRLTGWQVSLVMTVGLLLFSILWYFGVRTITLGHFAGINALLIALGLLLIQQEQDVPAGVFLALSTAAPQMSLLLVLFALVWAVSVRRSGLVLGILGGFTGLMVVSLFLIPDWPLQMLFRVLDYSGDANTSAPISIIASIVPGIGDALKGVLYVVFILYMLVEWILAWKKDERWFSWTALMTIVIASLLAVRSATPNYLMLLPALFLMFRIWEQRWGRFGYSLVWLVLSIFLVGLWLLFLTTLQGRTEHPVMYLPLPFFCLFGLWWIRWWAIRPPRLLLDDFAERMG